VTSLPSFLAERGYGEIPEVKSLNLRTHLIEGALYTERRWEAWGGILEYIACVEFAREALHLIPTGRDLGSTWIVPAQYYAASLVFFAQAALDNLAVWLCDQLALKAKGSNCSLNKSKFQTELSSAAPELGALVAAETEFLDTLISYRMEWVHRISGGAHIFSDKNPGDPTAQISVMVPLDPRIHRYRVSDPTKYIARIEELKATKGRWLYPVGEFAELIAGGTKRLTLTLLAQALEFWPSYGKPKELKEHPRQS
jgi:hypothetical protein